MATRIIPYQTQTRAGGGYDPGNAPLDTSAGGVAAIGAKVFGDVARITDNIAQQEAKAEAARAYSQAEIDEQQQLDAQSGARVANPDGFGKDYINGLDQRNNERGAALSGLARRYFTQMTPELRTSFGRKAVDWEFGARQTKTRADMLMSYDNTMASLYAGTISRDEAVKRANALATSWEQSGLATPADVAKLRLTAGRDADWYALMRQIKQNPVEMSRALSGKGRVIWDSATTVMPQASSQLVDAVIGQESGALGTNAESNKGASGLMQIMPDTARDLDPALAGMSDDQIKAKLKSDPEYNKQQGTKYLNQMLEKYNGDTVLALAAYNAGPGRVDAALKSVDPKTQGYDAFLSALPKETQDYVPSVLGRMGAKIEAPQMQNVSGLSADDIIKAQNIAETEARSQAAGARAGLEMDVENDLALYSEGETVANPKKFTDFAAAYPDNPDLALKKFNEYDAARTTGAAIASMKGMTNTQIVERVQSLKPDDPNDPNYANKRNGWITAARAAQTILSQRSNDPGAYVQKQMPDVAQAWIDYGNATDADRGTALQRATKASLAAQSSIGIPETQQDALPKAVRDGMIDNIRNAPPPQAWAQLRSLGQELGDSWSDVFKSISTGDGALPRDYQTLALIEDPTVGQAYAQALKLNREEGSSGAKTRAEAMLGKDPVSAIPKNLASDGQFVSFLHTIAMQGGDSLVNQQADAATQSMYMLAPSMGIEDAQARVVSAFTGKYDIIDSGRIVARAPQGLGDRMRAVASWYQTYAPSSDFRQFAALEGSGYPTDQLARDLTQFRSNAMWVTAPDESGWMMRSGGAVVQRPDTSPVILKFEDIASLEQQMNAQRQMGATPPNMPSGVPGIDAPSTTLGAGQ
jgi:soluble lytic murein transglycosylase-like protein